MGFFDSFFHPEKGYQKGQEQLEKYYQQAQGYQQPYAQQGQDAYGPLAKAMEALLNPQGLQNQWASSYSESPEAKMAEEMAKTRGMDTASSMGLGGSSTALQGIQAGTSGIALEDRRNYMNDLMQKYLAGTGLAQGIYNQGSNTAGQMGTNAMNMGQNSAQTAYGQQNAPGDLFGKLLGGAAGLVGGALGGPLGAAAGVGLNKGYNAWNRSGQYGGGN